MALYRLDDRLIWTPTTNDANQELGANLKWLIPQHSHQYTAISLGITTEYGGSGKGKISSMSANTGVYPPAGSSHIGEIVRPPAYTVTFFKRIN